MVVYSFPSHSASYVHHTKTRIMADAKANAEALVPRFKLERILNQGKPPLSYGELGVLRSFRPRCSS